MPVEDECVSCEGKGNYQAEAGEGNPNTVDYPRSTICEICKGTGRVQVDQA